MFNKKPRAVIFDWDNTIINTIPTMFDTMNKFMKIMNKPSMSIEEVKENTRRTSKENLQEKFGDDWQKAKEIWIDTYNKNHSKTLTMMPNAEEILTLLQDSDVKLFVISNKIGSLLRKEAEDLGIKDKFLCIIGSDDSKYFKPDREVVEYALEGTDIDPKKDTVWFIGDGENDIECAINSGCVPIVFGEDCKLIKERFKHRECPEIYEVENFSNLLEQIKFSLKE